MKRKRVLIIVLLMGIVATLEVGHSSAIQCVMPEEYRFVIKARLLEMVK